MNTKDTNPKDAVGIRKAAMSTVPAQPLMELGLAMMEGARKYGRHNYRIAGVRASVYYDAALRHLTAWWEGEDDDPDSALPHLVKAMACLCVIRDSVIRDNWIDDRPPSMVDGWQVELNKKAADLLDRLPDSKPAYTKSYRESATEALSRHCSQTTPASPLPLTDSPAPTDEAEEYRLSMLRSLTADEVTEALASSKGKL